MLRISPVLSSAALLIGLSLCASEAKAQSATAIAKAYFLPASQGVSQGQPSYTNTTGYDPDKVLLDVYEPTLIVHTQNSRSFPHWWTTVSVTYTITTPQTPVDIYLDLSATGNASYPREPDHVLASSDVTFVDSIGTHTVGGSTTGVEGTYQASAPITVHVSAVENVSSFTLGVDLEAAAGFGK